MASSADYQTLLEKFVGAFPAGDKATLSSLTSNEVIANDNKVSNSAFVDFLVDAYNHASPHAMSIDMTTIDISKKTLATRLLHKGILTKPYLGAEVTGEEVEWPEHLVLSFDDEHKIVGCHAAFGFGGPTKVADHDVKVQPTKNNPIVPPQAGFNLAEAYAGYIKANNEHTIRNYFPTFIADPVSNNGTPNTREEFVKMIEWNWKALEGVQLDVQHLLVDEKRQLVVADLKLTATPVKEFHGVPPDGKQVTFGEIAFYKFNGGLVEQIWVVLDLRALGK